MGGTEKLLLDAALVALIIVWSAFALACVLRRDAMALP